VELKTQPGSVTVKGKLGTLTIPMRSTLEAKVESGHVAVESRLGSDRPHVGTARAHITNAIAGVSKGFEKALELRGMGYRAQKTKEGVQLSCGYSHQVNYPAPAGITFDVNQAPDPEDPKLQMFEITVKGFDRHLVGQVAADLHRVKPPDVYRGKGVRHKGQRIRKKQGKRAAGTQA
jgi:large subunit ribosomal protein L6